MRRSSWPRRAAFHASFLVGASFLSSITGAQPGTSGAGNWTCPCPGGRRSVRGNTAPDCNAVCFGGGGDSGSAIGAQLGQALGNAILQGIRNAEIERRQAASRWEAERARRAAEERRLELERQKAFEDKKSKILDQMGGASERLAMKDDDDDAKARAASLDAAQARRFELIHEDEMDERWKALAKLKGSPDENWCRMRIMMPFPTRPVQDPLDQYPRMVRRYDEQKRAWDKRCGGPSTKPGYHDFSEEMASLKPSSAAGRPAPGGKTPAEAASAPAPAAPPVAGAAVSTPAPVKDSGTLAFKSDDDRPIAAKPAAGADPTPSASPDTSAPDAAPATAQDQEPHETAAQQEVVMGGQRAKGLAPRAPDDPPAAAPAEPSSPAAPASPRPASSPGGSPAKAPSLPMRGIPVPPVGAAGTAAPVPVDPLVKSGEAKLVGDPDRFRAQFKKQSGQTCVMVSVVQLLSEVKVASTEDVLFRDAFTHKEFSAKHLCNYPVVGAKCPIDYDPVADKCSTTDAKGRVLAPAAFLCTMARLVGGTSAEGMGALMGRWAGREVQNGYVDSVKKTIESLGARGAVEQFQYNMDYELPAARDEIIQALGAGKAVMVTMESQTLWKAHGRPAMHAVVVTAAVKRLDGSVEGFYINDSGTGEYARFVPSRDFDRAWLNDDLQRVYLK